MRLLPAATEKVDSAGTKGAKGKSITRRQRDRETDGQTEHQIDVPTDGWTDKDSLNHI